MGVETMVGIASHALTKCWWRPFEWHGCGFLPTHSCDGMPDDCCSSLSYGAIVTNPSWRRDLDVFIQGADPTLPVLFSALWPDSPLVCVFAAFGVRIVSELAEDIRRDLESTVVFSSAPDDACYAHVFVGCDCSPIPPVLPAPCGVLLPPWMNATVRWEDEQVRMQSGLGIDADSHAPRYWLSIRDQVSGLFRKRHKSDRLRQLLTARLLEMGAQFASTVACM